MPKSSRGTASGQLRSHSRSSSATKLGANLQFTQPAPPAAPSATQTSVQKARKPSGNFEAHTTRAAPPLNRANSSQRVHSRDQIAKRLAPLHQQHPQAAREQQQVKANFNTGPKKGFSIAGPKDDPDDDEDDEWESSESGAATPSQEESGSDTASDDGLNSALHNLQISSDPRPPQHQHQQQIMQQQQQQHQHDIYQEHAQQQQYLQQQQYKHQLHLQQQQALQQHQKYQQQHQYQPPQRQLQSDFPPIQDSLVRVNTARPSDFEQPPRQQRITTPRPPSPPRQQHQQEFQPPPPVQQHRRQQSEPQQPQQPRQQPPEQKQQRQPPPPPQHPAMNHRPQPTRSQSDAIRESANGAVSHSQRSPRPSHKSRPPSTHSTSSRHDHALRPHPLFRGISHGHINAPKPAPLAPLTVVPTNSTEFPQLSQSPTESAIARNLMSSSPTSMRTSSRSPVSLSVADLPHSAGPFTSSGDGRRLSFSSARSVNTVPAHVGILASRDIAPWLHERTRTLSTASSSAALSSLANIPTATRPPSPQAVVFFPPVNPHSNVEAIHPLLPSPYLQNHLTVLARRTPLRDSYDRVIRAKNAR